jgi:hypothetical protein
MNPYTSTSFYDRCLFMINEPDESEEEYEDIFENGVDDEELEDD